MKKNIGMAAFSMILVLIAVFAVFTPKAEAVNDDYIQVTTADQLLTTGGKFKLMNDITLTAQKVLTADTTIDLNGHNLVRTNGRLFKTNTSGMKLTIQDSTAGYTDGVYHAGKLSGKTTEVGIILYSAQPNIQLIIEGGIFDGTGSEVETPTAGGNWGGAFYFYSSGSVRVSGGEFRNFKFANGAVFGVNGTSVNIEISGGEFHNNTAVKDSGGGVIGINGSAANSLVTISGGKFYNNKAANGYGGVIMINQAPVTLNISGGEFTNNSAKNGGAIGNYAGSVTSASINITGGTFSANQVTTNGGAINAGVPISIQKASFIGNIGNGGTQGGAIYALNTLTVGVQGDSASKVLFEENTSGWGGGAISCCYITRIYCAEFKNNSATGNAGGGAVMTNASAGVTLTIDGSDAKLVSFTGNTTSGTTNGGGAVWCRYDKDTVSIRNAVFSGNKAASGKGGAICSPSAFTIEKCEFTANQGNYGGAVYVKDTESKNTVVTLKDSSFEENIATKDGGAVYIDNSLANNSTIECNIGAEGQIVTFSENHSAEGKGGAVAVLSENTLNLGGAEFTENYAALNGGAVYIKNATAAIADTGFSANYSATGLGGALYPDGTSAVSFSGKVTATDNYVISGAAEIPCNFYLTQTVTAGTMDEESEVRYSLIPDFFEFCSAAPAGSEAYFVPDDILLETVPNGAGLKAVYREFGFVTESDINYEEGCGTDLVLTIDGPVSVMGALKINGTEVDASKYSMEADGNNTKLTISADYLDTLTKGAYSITVVVPETNTFNEDTLNVVEKIYTFDDAAAEFTLTDPAAVLTFACDGLKDNLTAVLVDDTALNTTDYTLSADETTVALTLTNAYLNTLSAGTHTINCTFTYGTCTARTFTVLAAPAYSFTAGAGASFTLSTDAVLTFTADGPFASFVKLLVNNAEVAPAQYTAEADGANTKITLSNAYLNTLTQGTYSIECVFAPGTFTAAEFTVAEPTYSYLEGDGVHYVKESGENLVLISDGLFEFFTGVKLDGEILAPQHYTAASGSTVVEIDSEYLDTLDDGEHEILLLFSFGANEAPATITIEPKPAPAGDSSLMILWISVMTAALGAAFVVCKRREAEH